jgi:glycosyltransferase involved in cell wall biosynthesis
MRIQIVSWRDPRNPKAGGAEVCLVEISRRLMARYGHRVAWFAPSFEGGAAAEAYEGIAIERRGSFASVHANALRRFFGAKKQSEADFFLEDYHGLTLGLGWFLKKPHVVFVHEVAGPIWFEMFGRPLSWVGFGLEKVSLRLLGRTHFIAVSESTKRDLVAHGIAPAMISTITEGADIPRVERAVVRGERASQFVFIGRICKMKRVDLLLEAFAKHRATCPESRLVLVGTLDEAFRGELESLMDRLDLRGAVELTGRVSQERKAELLQRSLALASCSMREGFGLVVVEANSQGTPALTFDVNGYRDLIERGKNGFMVPFPDVEALAAKMGEVVTMEAARYDALCASSLEVSRKYSWDDTAAEVNAILERITSKGSSDRS